MKSSSLRPHQSAILGAALASVVLWAVPGAQWAMLPLTYLNTHVHELCHAIATQATGGHVLRIEVYANGSGVTPVIGGSGVVLASAGYLGASLVGMLLMLQSRSEKAARMALSVLAITLALGMLLWVRGDGVGIASGLFWIAALAAAARYARGMTLLFLAQFVGVQQCLNSVDAVYQLLRISLGTNAHSDAKIMEQLTLVPAPVWAVLWCAISVALLTQGLRRAWSTTPPPTRSGRAG